MEKLIFVFAVLQFIVILVLGLKLVKANKELSALKAINFKKEIVDTIYHIFQTKESDDYVLKVCEKVYNWCTNYQPS